MEQWVKNWSILSDVQKKDIQFTEVNPKHFLARLYCSERRRKKNLRRTTNWMRAPAEKQRVSSCSIVTMCTLTDSLSHTHIHSLSIPLVHSLARSFSLFALFIFSSRHLSHSRIETHLILRLSFTCFSAFYTRNIDYRISQTAVICMVHFSVLWSLLSKCTLVLCVVCGSDRHTHKRVYIIYVFFFFSSVV